MDGGVSVDPDHAISHEALTFCSRRHGLLIGETFVPAASGQTFETFDPATGEVLASVPYGTAVDIDKAVSAAAAAFAAPSWARLAPRERGRLLWRISEVIEAHLEELAALEALDNGMPLANARGGVFASAEAFRYYSGWCTKLMGQTYNPSQGASDVLVYTRKEPVGVVGLITPWNFPLIMVAMKLAPALAAGCTCVLKPAEQTPLTALRLGEILLEAGLPPGAVNIVTGDAEAGAALVAHPKVRKVAFTGSTAVGREIVKGAAGNLKKVSLELGGKSPFLILDDADLDRAIPAAAMGIFSNAGQNCVAASRVYVHESCYDQVTEGMVAAAKAMRVGSPFNKASTMGPLITSEHRALVAGYVGAGLAQGARSLCGAGPIGERGYFYAPTVLVDVGAETALMTDEIFGPVVAVTPFSDADDLAEIANRSEFGLAASVWTRDLSKAHQLAHRIQAGNVGINNHGGGDFAVPLGGYKQSGWGRENGEPGLQLYLELKTVTVKLDDWA
jgi:phenylacetaldehyde dehydrogenase